MAHRVQILCFGQEKNCKKYINITHILFYRKTIFFPNNEGVLYFFQVHTRTGFEEEGHFKTTYCNALI